MPWHMNSVGVRDDDLRAALFILGVPEVIEASRAKFYDFFCDENSGSGSGIWFVKSGTGEIVGVAGFVEFEIFFAIRPEERRLGIGGLLVPYACRSILRESKGGRITAYVLSANRASVMLLERVGFKFKGREVAWGGGILFTRLCYHFIG